MAHVVIKYAQIILHLFSSEFVGKPAFGQKLGKSKVESPLFPVTNLNNTVSFLLPGYTNSSGMCAGSMSIDSCFLTCLSFFIIS